MMDGEDLWAIAGTIATTVGAPVTIEDTDSEVVAYSPGQEGSDDARVATILGMRVPQLHIDAMHTRHLDETLATATGLFVAHLPELGLLPRIVAPVRVDGELIGSIWAMTADPLDQAQEKALMESAALVAPYLLRRQTARQADAMRRADAVRTLLGGGFDAADAAERLDLPPGPLAVLALTVTPPADDTVGANDGRLLRRTQSILDAHLSAMRHRGICATIDDTGYAVVPATDDEAPLRIAREFQARTEHGARLSVGVGPTVPGPRDLARSRADAETVLRLLHRQSRTGTVAHLRDVYLDVLLMRAIDFADTAGYDPLGAITVLTAHDRRKGSALLESLDRYLACGEDIRAAATELHIHPNTLRYRLRRACDVADIDLADTDTKFQLRLQLRLRALRSSAD
ncbi:hypothetical protein GCM10029978_116020 [Actinoallomurus acanthiterrae]